MATSVEISDLVLRAVLSQELRPGGRLGEGQLAARFACSRTIVREALTRLAARGLVAVSARRGWYLADPSPDEVQEAFEARRIIETGLLRGAPPLPAAALGRLREHAARQRAALDGGDPAARSLLLGEFHVLLAESLGSTLLAATLRDLTARTTLSALQHQSNEDAAQSFAEHLGILAALEAGDMAAAEARMAAHLGSWRGKLRVPRAD